MENNHKNIDSNETDWQIILTEPEIHQAQELLQIATELAVIFKQPEKPVIIY